MSVTVLNQVEQVGFKGQSARIYLDQTSVENDLPSIEVGQPVTVQSDTETYGTVYSVDYYGNSFLIVPKSPEMKFGYITFQTSISVG